MTSPSAATSGIGSDLVDEAEEYLATLVLRTPCELSPALSRLFARPVWLKWELMQPTRSFKVRGALVKSHQLQAAAGTPLIGTASTGNHGLGVAYAARIHHQQAVVFAPEGANQAKLQAIRELGAEVRIVGVDWQSAYTHATAACAEEGIAYVHSFDDPYIVAGQATIGTEIAAQVPGAAAVIVPIGGGGLIAGVATGLSVRGSSAAVIGVQPAGADAMRQSLAAGHPVVIPAFSSIADGLAARQPGELTFAITQALVREVRTVPEPAIRRAMATLLRTERLLVEPSAATTVATLAEHDATLPDGDVVCVISGGNVNPVLLPALVAELS
jgi:threonine dehydratase